MRTGAGHSVRSKLLLIVLATALVSLLVSGAAMMLFELRAFQTSWKNDLNAQADILGRASAAALAFDDPKSANAYLALLKAMPSISAAAIYSVDGQLFAKYEATADGAIFPPVPKQDDASIEGDELTLFRTIRENNETLGTVYLRARFDFYQWLEHYLGVLALVMSLGLLVALIFSVWLQRALTNPILAVSNVARRIMEERDFSLRAKKTTDDEIGYLVDAFNDMLNELGRSEHELRNLNAELEQRVHERTADLESANKELEAFSYSVSHDLRAPLRAISGFVTLLKEDHSAELGDEAKRKLDTIRSAAHRMGNLIDGLLGFSRLGRKAMHWVAFDMHTLVQQVYQDLQQQTPRPNVRFELAAMSDAMADPELIEHVWINLLSNALKFSSRRAQPLIQVTESILDGEHIYCVQDNGAGFDPIYKQKLFGVFQRLHAASEFEGTGVGLALVERIVTRHGGRVWADAKPDVGASFYFSLPVAPIQDN